MTTYETIQDLPFVLQINLPEEALEVYRAAFNRAVRNGTDARRAAESQAWTEVRKRFARDKVTGRWMTMGAGERATSGPSPATPGR